MHDTILLVDDDQNLLDSLKRQLRSKFVVETALGPREGLIAITKRGPFAVIVSDLRMPMMDGIHFLSNVSKITPDSIRIMLTGYADLENVIQALNEGHIFRFLTKPCDPEILSRHIEEGIAKYHLVATGKELLDKTLKGGIKVLTDLMSMLNHEVFVKSSRIRHYAREVALSLGISDPWEIETAAMLSQIGYVTLPETVLKKLKEGIKLSDAEMHVYESHPGIASNLLAHIPGMGAVAEAISNLFKHFDGSGLPLDFKRESAISIGGRILKAVSDYDFLESGGVSPSQALGILHHRTGHYDAQILAALEKVLGVRTESRANEVFIKDLKAGMVFSVDVKDANGRLLATKGQEVSGVIISRLNRFVENMEILEPLRVLEPKHFDSDRF